MRIEIEEFLQPFVPATVARLGYLHPDWNVRIADNDIVADCLEPSQGTVRKECLYLLYREKVFADALPVRQRLIERLLG